MNRSPTLRPGPSGGRIARAMPHKSIAALTFIVLLASGCSRPGSDEDSDQSEPRTRDPLAVELTTVTRRPLDRLLSVTCELVATREAEVTSRLTGTRVAKVLKEQGDRVSAGTPLAELEAVDLARLVSEAELALEDARLAATEARARVDDAKVAVLEARAEQFGQSRVLEQARKKKERAEAQASRGALSEEMLDERTFEVDRERANFERRKLAVEKALSSQKLAEQAVGKADLAVQTTELALKKARRDLSDAVIQAPIDGVLSSRDVSIGALAASGQVLYRIYDPESLRGEMRLPQQALRQVRVGLPVRLQSEIWPAVTFLSTVERISPVIDRANGVVDVRLVLDIEATLSDTGNAESLAGETGQALATAIRDRSAFRPGLFFTGDIVLERRPDALTVPRRAVGNLRGRPYLFVVRDADPDAEEQKPTVERHFFREGISSDGFVQVLGLEANDRPLEEGTRVVLVGLDRLRDGDQVHFPGSESEPSEEEAEEETATTNTDENER